MPYSLYNVVSPRLNFSLPKKILFIIFFVSPFCPCSSHINIHLDHMLWGCVILSKWVPLAAHHCYSEYKLQQPDKKGIRLAPQYPILFCHGVRLQHSTITFPQRLKMCGPPNFDGPINPDPHRWIRCFYSIKMCISYQPQLY